MKKIIAIFLLFVLLLQISGKLAVFAYYEINKKYISENLCENRNKPQLHCNGKCHLAKELRKEEKKEQSPANPLKDESQIFLFSEISRIIVPQIAARTCEHSSFYLITPYTTFLKSLEHPPCC